MTLGQCSCSNGKKNNEKVYQIAAETSFAPFAYMDESGSYAGIDIDLFNAIAEDQNIKFEFQYLGFEASCAALETNQADGAMCCLSIKEERKEKYDFSDPYYESSVITVVENNSKTKKLSDLKNKKIGAKMGTDADKYACDICDEYGGDVVLVEDFPTALMMLQSGKIDALVDDTNVVSSVMLSDDSIKKIGDPGYRSDLGFAVSKSKNGELLKAFNEGLKNIRENGKYDEILKKYVG
ncbi:MAG: transporter substrate-binding domain-containing protein [Oscillospiraceae bacterium]|nr:transporter substrate-binding domain-containing protein [Oscillospiraceae bacterium]